MDNNLLYFKYKVSISSFQYLISFRKSNYKETLMQTTEKITTFNQNPFINNILKFIHKNCV